MTKIGTEMVLSSCKNGYVNHADLPANKIEIANLDLRDIKLGKKRNIYNIFLEVQTKRSYTQLDSTKQVIRCSILVQSDIYTEKKLSKH